jgi:hypothetical protein
MTELRYPAFPRRAFLAAGTLLFALMAIAVIINQSGPSLSACARAAERVMVAYGYSVETMELSGQRSVPACGGLSDARYLQALLDTYRIEYGRVLPQSSRDYAVPPPSYRARSARTESRSLS